MESPFASDASLLPCVRAGPRGLSFSAKAEPPTSESGKVMTKPLDKISSAPELSETAAWMVFRACMVLDIFTKTHHPGGSSPQTVDKPQISRLVSSSSIRNQQLHPHSTLSPSWPEGPTLPTAHFLSLQFSQSHDNMWFQCFKTTHP